MKKLLATALLLISSQHIFAQLEKGMFAAGLKVGITTSKNENESNYSSTSYYYYKHTDKLTTTNISPEINYFISKRFSIGIQIGYTGSIQTNENTNKSHANTAYNINASTSYDYSKSVSAGITIAPNIKYYIPLSEHLYFLIQGSYAASISNVKNSGHSEYTTYDAAGNITSNNNYDGTPSKSKTFVNAAGISPGILFMPSKKIGIQFSLGNFISINSTSTKTPLSNGTSKSTVTNLQFVNLNTFSANTGIYYFF